MSDAAVDLAAAAVVARVRVAEAMGVEAAVAVAR
jgi:hypothetical protein